jgi:hypothetical protein
MYAAYVYIYITIMYEYNMNIMLMDDLPSLTIGLTPLLKLLRHNSMNIMCMLCIYTWIVYGCCV